MPCKVRIVCVMAVVAVCGACLLAARSPSWSDLAANRKGDFVGGSYQCFWATTQSCPRDVLPCWTQFGSQCNWVFFGWYECLAAVGQTVSEPIVPNAGWGQQPGVLDSTSYIDYQCGMSWLCSQWCEYNEDHQRYECTQDAEQFPLRVIKRVVSGGACPTES